MTVPSSVHRTDLGDCPKFCPSSTTQVLQSAVSLLSKMPAWGARREHFKKMYLKSEAGLRKLPRDPRNIPSGLWHQWGGF
ncbi:hypothetical protein QWZ16_23530 [Vibrio ostreicida]|uniref:Uncharacterized protein n=1 Tax=Vibrio ostreicida TaxID=526588 RepID=A0ABT8C2Y0_9VIBR|nr:hypothetical protein [Vibrio ostreicida]MDN3612575.1 hypothetical protein [Vibrio ostreicida]